MTTFIIAIGIIALFLIGIFLSVFFRIVVDPNMVHIVQTRKKTTSFGKDKEGGNVYYNWPRWFPLIGLTRIVLPVSNFDLSLDGYKSYDKEKVPFELDLTAFFRIKDTNIAAQRVESFEELLDQLLKIVAYRPKWDFF